jgi:hypothetical protein
VLALARRSEFLYRNRFLREQLELGARGMTSNFVLDSPYPLGGIGIIGLGTKFR